MLKNFVVVCLFVLIRDHCIWHWQHNCRPISSDHITHLTRPIS